MTAEVQTVEIPPQLTVRELAEDLSVSPIAVIKELMNNGIMASINQMIDFDTAAIVGEEMGFELVPLREEEPEPAVELAEAVSLRHQFIENENPDDLELRPPVVTILGHVDHGKTTLLDTIRHTSVVSGEAGGITQHIGSYQVTLEGRKITFLDTPGHEAFTAMRARGAMVTDLVILIVAADDGVMPQTKEAIGHARAAGVPIIVAINKIDKPNANIEKVKQDLANEGLVPDDWGGDTVCVSVSASNNVGIDDLLENILLATEIAELKANPDHSAQGTVIEGKLDEKRGVVANLLVQNGTLKQGDMLVIDTKYGRARAMFNDRGQRIKSAGPSTPVSILGMSEVPDSGEIFEVVPNKKAAEALVERHLADSQAAQTQSRSPMSLEDFLSRLEGEEIKQLNLIIKADVHGSLEPITNSLRMLGDEQHKVKIILQGTGNISESDITLAVASNAIVVGFNVSEDEPARLTAELEKVEVRIYRVIYKLIEDIDLALKGLYEPVYEDRVIGHAEVRATFRVGKRTIAGSYITAGKFNRHAKVRVVRNRELLHVGEISTLKRFTEDVEEVASGYECGINIENFNDFKVGDILEAFVHERVN